MNITFEGKSPFLAMYRIVLEKAIHDVCEKLSLTPSPEITWIIFDSNRDLSQLSPMEQMIVKSWQREGHEYGHCNPKSKKIWISTMAIESYNIAAMPSIRIPGIKPVDCLLANVIMDELAHINTGRNHGDPVYDRELISYRSRYYS